MKRKKYTAPQTQEYQIETTGVLMGSFGPGYMPSTPVTPP